MFQHIAEFALRRYRRRRHTRRRRPDFGSRKTHSGFWLLVSDVRFYLIPFTPHAVVTDRQEATSTLPSPLVFRAISTHFTAPPHVPCASPPLKAWQSGARPQG